MSEKLLSDLEGLHHDVFSDLAFHYRMGWIFIAGAVLQETLWMTYLSGSVQARVLTHSLFFCFSLMNLALAWRETCRVGTRYAILRRITRLKEAVKADSLTDWDYHYEQLQAEIRDL